MQKSGWKLGFKAFNDKVQYIQFDKDRTNIKAGIVIFKFDWLPG